LEFYLLSLNYKGGKEKKKGKKRKKKRKKKKYINKILKKEVVLKNTEKLGVHGFYAAA
jgi:hypothetical protein